MFKVWLFSVHTDDLGSSFFNLVNFVITAIESAYAKCLFMYSLVACSIIF